MATIYGISGAEYFPQNDFVARQTDKGGWVASRSYTYAPGALDTASFRNDFPQGRRASDIDATLETWIAERLYLDRVDLVDGNGPWKKIIVHYAGYAGTETDSSGTRLPTTPVFRLKGTLRERSLAQHPSVVALALDQRLLVQGVLEGIYWWDEGNSKLLVVAPGEDPGSYVEAATQPDAGDATDFVKAAAAGNGTYLAPGFSWEAIFDSEQPLASSDINDLGKVDTPQGNPPEASGTRDWLLVDASQEQSGELYRCRLEWEMSDDGGWDSDIYDY